LRRVSERRRAVALAHDYRDVEGLTIRQIADRLGRAPATIQGYIYNPPARRHGRSRPATSLGRSQDGLIANLVEGERVLGRGGQQLQESLCVRALRSGIDWVSCGESHGLSFLGDADAIGGMGEHHRLAPADVHGGQLCLSLGNLRRRP